MEQRNNKKDEQLNFQVKTVYNIGNANMLVTKELMSASNSITLPITKHQRISNCQLNVAVPAVEITRDEYKLNDLWAKNSNPTPLNDNNRSGY